MDKYCQCVFFVFLFISGVVDVEPSVSDLLFAMCCNIKRRKETESAAARVTEIPHSHRCHFSFYFLRDGTVQTHKQQQKGTTTAKTDHLYET